MNENKYWKAVSTRIPIKPCPFCAGEARLICACDQERYAVLCGQCQACFPLRYHTYAEALARWNRRSGGVSAAGGRATKGLSSRKKIMSCRKNLMKARDAKKLLQINAAIDITYPILKAARQAEIAELEASIAERRARLKAREAEIMADPEARSLYAQLKPLHSDHKAGLAVNEV